MNAHSIEHFWQAFLSSLPVDSPFHNKGYVAEGWGDSPEMADELGALIAAGKKTATCSALWEWDAAGETPPEAGTVTVVMDGGGEPLCIIESIEVTVRKYKEVDSAFAREEGEGDLSLEYWREAHRRFFSRSLSKIGREFSENIPLVCERFRLIYKPEATLLNLEN